MQKKQLTHKHTYQPVSRGLIEHFQYWSGSQLKLYMYCLLMVKATGEKKGIMTGYVSDWCDDLGWVNKMFYRTIKSLASYLTFKTSQSRHKPAQIIVQRYKGIEDFHFQPIVDSSVECKVECKVESSGKVDSATTIKQNDLQAPKKEIRRKGEKEEIVAYLNQVCGTSFKAQTKTTDSHISARLKEGFTVADFKKVIDGRFKEWGKDPKMCEYLRPVTLFGQKFEGYLQHAKVGVLSTDRFKRLDLND